ncbi:MAG TPA: uroporphyrinogen-III synthase [Candidatus Kryptonia bacterium]|nr:uroporphyrinogen-III synthase [Candidatus Kryptonia bacterium]
MAQTFQADLSGLTVLALESRRAHEMAELIRRYGGVPVIAPSLREVPIANSGPALALLEQLEQGAIDVVILLTGVGTRMLVAAVAPRCARERFAALLRRCKLVARGPKPVGALRELGLTPALVVPEPNTWREILAALDRDLSVTGLRVAVQEYGAANPELLAGLRARGAEVFVVPLYRWTLPEDLAPMRAAIAALLEDRIDVVLFTSATQVDHFLLVARENGVAEARLRHAFGRALIASIGPICSQALRRHGLAADLEPEHGKMGQLVAAAARRGRDILAAKRAA